MKTLYLIDGYAQFFRAYHAIRSRMTSPVTKEPTNATFGFIGMLLKLLREKRPDYVAVAIDVSGDRESFRSELYPEYKANRDAPPEDLGPQIARCLEILEAVGVPVVGAASWEADDVIATLADHLSDSGVRVRIVSKDKDLQQLLEEGRVEMYDVHTDELLDVARLREEKGIGPGQIVDMLTLMGDTVDNVPGVPGIGPKTAAQLIADFGSLDALMARASEVKGKRGESLRASAEMLPLSRELVTLRLDAPVELDLEQAAVERFALKKLQPFLRELGFNRYQDELEELLGTEGEGAEARGPEGTDGEEASGRGPGAGRAQTRVAGGFGGLFDAIEDAADGTVRAAPGDYRCVRTGAELDELVAELREAALISVDTETTSTRPMRAALCGLSFSTRVGTGWYVPIRSPEPDTHLDEPTVLGTLRGILEDPAKKKCGHNLKYDLLVFRRHGVELRGITFDSMIASYVIDASRSSHSLDNLSMALLGHTSISIRELLGTGKSQITFDGVPVDRATIYAAEDADLALRLEEKMAPQLRVMKLQGLFDDIEMALLPVLAELEWNGIRVDPDELDRQAERLSGRINELRQRIIDESPRAFNPDSPKQLASILFNAPEANEPGLGIKPLKRTKTGYSTDVDVLERLALDPEIGSPVPELVVEYRQLTKLVGTYLTALKEEINPETGRIHASFNQTVAATGRLSSSDPNLQNIPIRTDVGREIRKAFVAPGGRVLIGADYSQIELRLLAHLSRDAALIEAFHAGADIHTAVAAQIHGVPPKEVSREQRNGAKMVNFGIIYGVTPFGLARRLRIGQSEAATIIDDYKTRFPGITTFLAECVSQAARYGYVETILGRRRPITDIESRNQSRRALAERMAINSVVQGSAADLIKIAMIDLYRRLSRHAGGAESAAREPEAADVQMLLQIHDELLFEAPEDEAEAARDLIVSRMEAAMELSVPLVVDSGISRTWFEGK